MSLSEEDIKSGSETVNVEDVLANFFLEKFDMEGSDRSESDSKYKKKSKHKKHKSGRRSDSSESRNSNIIKVADILANFFLKKIDLNGSDFSESDSKYMQKSKHKKHKSGRRSESRNSNRISVEDILANFFLEKFGMEGLDRSESDSKYKKKSKHKSGSSERSSNSMSRRSRTRSHQRRRRSRSWSFSEDAKSRHSARWRSRSTSRNRRSSSSESCKIDQAKIREIAEKNLLIMIQQGTLPQCIKELLEYFKEKELVSIRAGGKSVQELTDFCVKLSNKENEETDDMNDVKDAGNVKEENDFIHHPFKLKEHSVIKFDIKSAVRIPIKTRAEKFPKLSSRFPVSSGSRHKKKELKWVPVVPEQNKSDLKQSEVKNVVPVESVAAPKTAVRENSLPPSWRSKRV